MTRHAVWIASLVLVAAAVFAGTSAATLHSNQGGCASATGTKIAQAGMYRFALRFGAAERMYTLAEVRKLHPTSGEVMVGGAMMAMPGMGMNRNTRHLEVQICKGASRSVLMDAMPRIALTDLAGGKVINVPVAKMRGVDANSADIHYGNNVTIKSGHRYRVAVAAMAATARFIVKAS